MQIIKPKKKKIKNKTKLETILKYQKKKKIHNEINFNQRFHHATNLNRRAKKQSEETAASVNDRSVASLRYLIKIYIDRKRD